MSSIKRYMNETENYENLQECLEALLETDSLKGPAIGIAKQLAADPEAQLSVNQQEVFDKYIAPQLAFECTAPDCRQSIPSDLVPGVIISGYNDAYCHECAYTHRDRGDD